MDRDSISFRSGLIPIVCISTHSLTSARGSSEYAITHLLAPGAHARWPIADRVHKLNIPIAFVYGDHDCKRAPGSIASHTGTLTVLALSGMDIKGGYDSVASMRRAGNNHGKVIEISHAGVSGQSIN